jgi:hypothetical protein
MTTWHKSSYSGAGSNDCVEVANTLDRLRDSKNPTGPVLSVDLGGLLTAVKAGRWSGDGVAQEQL